MKIEVETIKRVYTEQGDGSCLEVLDNKDYPDYLGLRTTDDVSERAFGKVSITMSADFAIALGQALIDCGEIRKKQLAKSE